MTRAPGIRLAEGAALAAFLAAGCAGTAAPGAPPPAVPAAPPARYRLEEVPRELRPAVARAEAAVRTLREQLAARLAGELASGGVARAARVCGRETAALAAGVSAQTGVAVGRTGAFPRPGGAPPRPWIAPFLEDGGRRADAAPVVLDLGDRVGLLRPIALGASCLACHGPSERVLPEVKAAADAGVPPERAAGFSEGDLRGFFWAEAPKEKR